MIGDYALESLKREKDDAREVPRGLECGIKLGGFNDLKEGDVLEAYKIEEIRPHVLNARARDLGIAATRPTAGRIRGDAETQA